MGFWGLGFGVLGFGDWGLGFGVWGLGFRALKFRAAAQGLGFRVEGRTAGCRNHV